MLPTSGDLLYDLIGAGIGCIVGFALIMKSGQKFGWIIVAVAVYYAWLALQPTIRAASGRNVAPARGGYYRTK